MKENSGITREWFTRFPQKATDPDYLSSITEATKYFMDWFSNGNTPYTTMLRRMHEIVSNNGYRGHTCSHGPVVITHSFRNESMSYFPILKKEWFTGIPDEPIIKPKVKGISAEQAHWLQNSDEGYTLHLPDGKYVCVYLRLMHKLIDEIKSNTNLNLVTLANYMHLFVIGHPFEKINFSICMAQVNAMLHMKGYKTLYHEWMDFECFLYDYPDIVFKFIAKSERIEQ